jgi:plastocyanin
VALLHLVRDRAAVLSGCVGSRRARVAGAVLVAISFLGAACGPSDSELPPDRRLQTELGLDASDRVHEVVLTGGPSGGAEPPEAQVLPGDYLQFVSADSWVHEIVFEVDSLQAGALAFMDEHDQLSSPPMVSRGSRFVISFVEAPEGRYPYRVEGNQAPVRGVIVVTAPPAR